MTAELAPKPMSALQFTCRLSCPQIEQLWHMYQAEWWSRGRDSEDQIGMLDGAPYVFNIAAAAPPFSLVHMP